ncbi:MAG TPA: 4-hydroxybenzoate octaprenyltransferase, partial [Ectothiorhodospiraceae bacterium]|nr:4-hydroxybenzoate octaprenyltransferase [Ectothiorhodospiraceae bacterium]
MSTVTFKLREYSRLVRLDRPIGIYLVLWPTLWALWIAAEGVPNPLILIVFVAGVVLMRSAGCAINDFADRKIDAHVARTAQRPLVAGTVSPKEA